jgi:hypothetical protein
MADSLERIDADNEFDRPLRPVPIGKPLAFAVPLIIAIAVGIVAVPTKPVISFSTPEDAIRSTARMQLEDDDHIARWAHLAMGRSLRDADRFLESVEFHQAIAYRDCRLLFASWEQNRKRVHDVFAVKESDGLWLPSPVQASGAVEEALAIAEGR